MLSGRSGFLGIGLMLEPKLRQTRAAQSLQSDGASPSLTVESSGCMTS